jgi:hypothetical protein
VEPSLRFDVTEVSHSASGCHGGISPTNLALSSLSLCFPLTCLKQNPECGIASSREYNPNSYEVVVKLVGLRGGSAVDVASLTSPSPSRRKERKRRNWTTSLGIQIDTHLGEDSLMSFRHVKLNCPPVDSVVEFLKVTLMSAPAPAKCNFYHPKFKRKASDLKPVAIPQLYFPCTYALNVIYQLIRYSSIQ